MAIALNHTIVPAVDNKKAAAFFAAIMGSPYLGSVRHFAPVRVNDQLTLDFMSVEDPVGLHLAFDVDPVTVDEILARLCGGGVPYGSEPGEPDNGRTDHPLCPRGLYFTDDARNLYEACHLRERRSHTPSPPAAPAPNFVIGQVIWCGRTFALVVRTRRGPTDSVRITTGDDGDRTPGNDHVQGHAAAKGPGCGWSAELASAVGLVVPGRMVVGSQ